MARIDPVTGIFNRISWSELESIVNRDALHELTRTPEDLAHYGVWKKETVARYGSVEQYILQQRLHWSLPISPASPVPFEEEEDWCCVRNDFPYAFERGITHLVIWMKNTLDTEMRSGKAARQGDTLTSMSRERLERFIARQFADVPGRKRIHFLNPPGLRSIGNLEHVHVLLKDVDGAKYLTRQS